MKKQYKHCIFLDAGHGGVTPEGVYTTAPSKMWTHKQGIFHNGSTFYEGVKNREYADAIAEKLVAKGYNVVKTYHPYLDTPLSRRVQMANYYHDNIQKGIFVSEHSNAASQTARGFSIWTSKGQTQSDFFAEEFMKMYKADLSDDITRIMEDRSDGDADYEANFYVLRETKMPAILMENLFFDNYNDTLILMDSYYKDQYVDVMVNWLEWSIEHLDKNG